MIENLDGQHLARVSVELELDGLVLERKRSADPVNDDGTDRRCVGLAFREPEISPIGVRILDAKSARKELDFDGVSRENSLDAGAHELRRKRGPRQGGFQM